MQIIIVVNAKKQKVTQACTNENGLQGQKQSALGNALGKRVSQLSPRQGKSLIDVIMLLPLQGVI
ncbi:MAG: hypothetical protein J5529_04505 [Prevotella sp.]|jgi:hypothetical protein|nr:hypothetical protein [Prevotella sp.]